MPKRLLFDGEADGLLDTVTKAHCIAAGDVDTRERFVWGPDQIPEALDVMYQADTLIAHNGLRYDFPMLLKVYKWKPRATVILRDSMVCSRTIYPNVKETDGALIRQGKMPPGKAYQGKHTIAAWGYRLGVPKVGEDIDDWSVWTQYMQDRCVGDVATAMKLWDHLKVDSYSQDTIDLEHRIAWLVDQMEQLGVPFDIKAAGELHGELVGKRGAIEDRLKAQIGFWLAPISPDPHKHEFVPKKPDKKMGYDGYYTGRVFEKPAVDKNGEPTGKVKKTKEFVGYPVCKLKRVDFNPGSRDHIAHVLKKRGWKPTEFTEGGKPQINEGVVAAVVQRWPDLNGLAEYLMVEKRLSQLADGDQAWLAHVKADGRIHGVINPMGTQTSRAAHMFPNLGQVPSLKKPYGHECRALFYVDPAWGVAVGADQEGLELRGLAHYLQPLDNGVYAQAVCTGDPHWLNACAMGLATGERDKENQLHTIVREDGSKRVIYAMIYGAGGFKVGLTIFNCLLSAHRQVGEEGTALLREFFKTANPDEDRLKRAGYKILDNMRKKIVGYDTLLQRLEQQVDKFGWVPGLDKRRVPTRAKHAALNYMIQSAGAIICKRWGVDAVDDLLRRGYKMGWDGGDFVPMLWVHDEYQIAARKEIAQDVGETLVRFAKTAGEPYGFRVPLDSKFKVGRSWADTH